MEDNPLTGIYFCHKSNGFHNTLDIPDLIAYSKDLKGISVVWYVNDINLSNTEYLVTQIKEKNLERLIIVGDLPGTTKYFFSRAMTLAGKDPKNVILASFQENGALTRDDQDLAKAIIYCAVLGVSFEEASTQLNATTVHDTLVIGAGIAGIQASLEIANGNQKVYLLERSGTIGGHMAMFDKTFPTLDCAACILTPKMVEVGQHSNIELLTYSEVKGVTGEPGNYKVKILNKARRVDLATCIGCGICSEKCPAKAPSEFDNGTTLRKAIYIPFPQAVPNKYLIDADSCTYVLKGKCGVCVKVCPVEGCIDLDAKDQETEITVGNIIVATGFKPFDAGKIERFGYGKYPQVITSLELERLINAAGPTEGNIHFRSQDKKGNWIFSTESSMPKSFAIIHCVGSRDENYNKYCSRVCCMYSLKLAHLIKEKLEDADVFEYYIDMRAFGKGYEEFYERIENEGIHIIRGRTAKIEERNGRLMVRSEDILNNQLIEQEVDMVVLSIGLEPREDASELAEMLGILTEEEGWFTEANYNTDPVNTFVGGITIAGVCQGPKDIPDAVAQGSAAAARVLQSIIKGKVKKSIKDIPLEKIEEKAKQFSNSMEGKS